MTMGAGIFCIVCGARPYPQLGPPKTREDFDLMRLNRKGRPAESPASGEWFCSRHFERMGRDYQVANGEPAHREATSEPLLWENLSESDAQPTTGDDPPRSFEDLDKIPF